MYIRLRKALSVFQQFCCSIIQCIPSRLELVFHAFFFQGPSLLLRAVFLLSSHIYFVPDFFKKKRFSIIQPHQSSSFVLLPSRLRSCNPCLVIGKCSRKFCVDPLNQTDQYNSGARQRLVVRPLCARVRFPLQIPLARVACMLSIHMYPSIRFFPFFFTLPATHFDCFRCFFFFLLFFSFLFFFYFFFFLFPVVLHLRFWVLLLLLPSPRLLQFLPQCGQHTGLYLCLRGSSISGSPVRLLTSEALERLRKDMALENTHWRRITEKTQGDKPRHDGILSSVRIAARSHLFFFSFCGSTCLLYSFSHVPLVLARYSNFPSCPSQRSSSILALITQL